MSIFDLIVFLGIGGEPVLPGSLIAEFGLNTCERSEQYRKNTRKAALAAKFDRTARETFVKFDRTARDFFLNYWRYCVAHNRASREIVNAS